MTDQKTLAQLAAEIHLLNEQAATLQKFYNAEKITATYNGKKLPIGDILQLKAHLNDTVADIIARKLILKHELDTRVNLKTA